MAAENAAQSAPFAETEGVQEVGLTIKGQSVRIQNGQGEVLEVFNLTGVKIASVKIEANDQSIQLNLNRGIYIFKVGKLVRKVAIA